MNIRFFLLLMLAAATTFACNKAPSPSNNSPGGSLDVVRLTQAPAGSYEVTWQLGGSNVAAEVEISGAQAFCVSASSPKLEKMSAEFILIGNGVFLAPFAGPLHRATQFWVFQPDGSAVIKEIPDRGEVQKAVRKK
jgi:hypothetical protein